MIKFNILDSKEANIIRLKRDESIVSQLCQIMVLIDDVIYVDGTALLDINSAGKYGYLRMFKALINKIKKGEIKYYAYEKNLLVPLNAFYGLANSLAGKYDVFMLSPIFRNTMQLIAFKFEYDLRAIQSTDLCKDEQLARFMLKQTEIDSMLKDISDTTGSTNPNDYMDALTDALKTDIPTLTELLADTNVTIPVQEVKPKLGLMQKLILSLIR